MSAFWGIARFEFGMMIRRRGLWLAYGLLFAFYAAQVPGGFGRSLVEGGEGRLAAVAAEIVYMLNMFMPLIGGLAVADRLVRDLRLGVRELQRSAPVRTGTWLLGKFVGVMGASAVPMFGFVLIIGAALAVTGHAPAAFVLNILIAWLAIALPALIFVSAFSLAFPLVLPLRVYQVLFTGYWFWGNYLNPKVFPTLSGTLLTPGGIFALRGFFGGELPGGRGVSIGPGAAALNIAVLAVLAAAALVAGIWLVDRRERVS
ncbi:MAG: hypothetical protein EHM24_33130 [Acidobacteria bacterium]|nr:MAG: hypothetical protein EHM24_33130 [Acidobacteriota bacterium]